MRRWLGVGFIAGMLLSGVCLADKALLARKDVQQFIHELVQHHNFDRKQLTAIFQEAEYQPKIIQSMDKPYEKKPWDIYKNFFLTTQRLQNGLAFWRANQAALAKAEKQFGVPASIIVAILGVETLYGVQQGNYRVLDALTTLAFYYPKRAPFFTKELREFLILCSEHHVPATLYRGSYAGAMGGPQFMPSSYRYYAANFKGNAKSDLMNDSQDAIASVANYLHHHGWSFRQSVAQPVAASGWGYKDLALNAKSANYKLNYLLSLGIKPEGSLLMKPSTRAGLIELDTQFGQEYWLAYPNFYVITHYNTSPQYALVVYLLSEQLNRGWHARARGRKYA